MPSLGFSRDQVRHILMLFEELEERIVLNGEVDCVSDVAGVVSEQVLDCASIDSSSNSSMIDSILTEPLFDEPSLVVESDTEWLPDGTWHWWVRDWDIATGNGWEFHAWPDGSSSYHEVSWDNSHNGYDYDYHRDGTFTYVAAQWNNGVGYDYTSNNSGWTYRWVGQNETGSDVFYDARSDGYSLYRVTSEGGATIQQTNINPEVWRYETVAPGTSSGDIITYVEYSNGYSEYTYTWADGLEFFTSTEPGEQIVKIGDESYSVVTLTASNSTTASSQIDGSIPSLDVAQYTPSDSMNEIVWGWEKGTNIINCDELKHLFIIYGGPHGDVITGGFGNDTIYGGDGNDVIHGGGGADTIYAQEGDDQVYGYKYPYEGEGIDGNDTIHLGSGADGALGAAGDDTIYGDSGEDLISGNSGNDRLYGGADKDLMWGEDGDDVMYGDGDAVYFVAYADAGNDAIDGGKGNDKLYGGPGSEIMGGLEGEDWLYGEEGNDYMEGNDDGDFMWGGPGDDFMAGDVTGDPITAGNDIMFGGEGNDQMMGNEFDDYMEGGSADNMLKFPETPEELFQFKYNDTLLGGDGNDIIYGDYYMQGGAGYDIHVIYGYDSGKNGLIGDHDIIDGGKGLDTIYGGPGTDKIEASEGRIKKPPQADLVYVDADDFKDLNPAPSVDDIDTVQMI